MCRVVLPLVLILLNAAPARAEWVRVDSPHFVVFGEVGEKRTRQYVAEFERFREALGRVVAGAAVRSAVPTVLFIFKDRQSFNPYRPFFNGRPVELRGYFVRDASQAVIMLDASDHDAALRIIFHEYSHLIIANVARGLPVWLNEGLAEYYSTVQIQSDGRKALLGHVWINHLVRLNKGGLLSLEELLAVTHDSPLYNEGERRSIFYAQSWALVHLLLNGDTDRAEALKQYLELVARGTSAMVAWRHVFGEAKILDELRRYVTRPTLRGYELRFDRSIEPASIETRAASRQNVLAALRDMRRLVRPERAPDATENLETISTPHALAVRGLLKLDDLAYEPALPLLLEAAKDPGDWLVAYRAAVGLETVANHGPAHLRATAATAALEALDRVLSVKPSLPHAWALKALVIGPSDDGLAAIQRARELAPGSENYAIWQAQFHVERSEPDEARALVEPLASMSSEQNVRDYARRVLGRAVALLEARQRSARQANASGLSEPARSSAPSDSGTVHHVFREVQPGEQRLEAFFERIECPRAGPVFHFRSADRSLRMHAPSLLQVEFITYTGQPSDTITCGPRKPPDPVYVTFRPAPVPSTSLATVVAIEFLPRAGSRRQR